MTCGGTAVAADLADRLAAARALVARCWPGAVERVMAGQGGSGYGYAAAETAPVVLRLVVQSPNLFLHFAQGAALPDPEGLLRGEGRRGRYLCLRDAAMLDDAAVAALVLAAIAGGSDGAADGGAADGGSRTGRPAGEIVRMLDTISRPL